MDARFQMKDNALKPAAGTRIIKAADYETLIKAEDLIAAAKARAADLEAKAQAVYQQRYQEGFTAGQAEGREEYALKIMDTVMSSLDAIEALESQLVKVVMDAITKIVGEMDADERILRIVHQALSTVRGSHRIVLKINPMHEKAVRRDLAPYLLSQDGASGYINLAPEPKLKPDDCILETDMGVVDSSLDSQLKILHQALSSRIKQRD